MTSTDDDRGSDAINISEKHQTEYMDAMITPTPPGEVEEDQRMSWRTYAGLLVSPLHLYHDGKESKASNDPS